MKLYTFFIPMDAAEGRLLPLVKRTLPQLPDSVIRAAFDRRDVKLDGQRVGRDAALKPGAEVRLYTAGEERPPLIPVLYRDNDLLVVRKPAGISCQRDPKGGATLPELLRAQLQAEFPGEPEPLLCHRLDNPTEGLLLLARNPEAQAAMEDGFRRRLIHKRYVCLVKGLPQPPAATLRAWLIKDARRARVRVLPRQTEGALPIVTEYRVLEGGECSRLEIALHTGRTHQIRAHMAYIGHPLAGDDLYGDRAFNRETNRKRLMLCAVSLAFSMDGRWRYLNEKNITTEPAF